jgi:tRNA modification GTPase
VQPDDTIVAISSAVGSAARMIVRLSGADAIRIAKHFVDAADFPTAAAARMRFRVRDLPEFPAWVYSFRSPRSVTGEDVIEFHLPGNPLLARMTLDDCIAHGARLADPGEFSARGYFNGRIDLAQAEGVAATIAANSAAELRAARQLLSGELARRLKPITELVTDTLALIEAGIDFVDEDISFLSREDAAARIDRTTAMLDQLLRDSTRFERLTHEPTIVLTGRPNAGKSTLLNALAGQERAIVSPIAGTTRDLLSAEVTLSRGRVRLIDAAGIDEAEATSEIERDMRSRALRAIETADVLILLHDCTDDRGDLVLPRDPDMRVLTKSDLAALPLAGFAIGARTGAGIDSLRQELDRLTFGNTTSGALALNARHVQLLEDARQALIRAAQQLDRGQELLALDLRETLDSLGGILGQITPDDVLTKLFATFCIGK